MSGTYIMIQALRRTKRKRSHRYIHSHITRIEEYQHVTSTMQESIELAMQACAKWREILGDRWLVIGSEVTAKEAAEVAADLSLEITFLED